jgi:hypothetical protein
MFDLTSLTPMARGRVEKSLDKKFNFSTQGILTLREFIERFPDGKKSVGDHMFKWNRHKFNRMSYAEQKAYESRLSKEAFFFNYSGDYSIEIPKIVYDILKVPVKDRR